MDSLSVSGALLRWSSVSWPLDLIVNKFRLPLLLRAEPGPGSSSECVGELVLVHSCRQWTAVTAHSLEEGHYVVGPRIEVPIHYTGWFKVLEQERDVGDPAQFFSSVEELAKAFPDRVFVIEDISFSVKVASGEFNEESELYHFALNAGDELTLMGQAEILCGRPSKDRSRLTTLLRKMGWLPGAAVNPRVARGKMPCLICMNHRTNESVSLPFECHGRFGTRSPLESQLHDGEHSLRSIVEHARLPVTVMVPSRPPPPRNPYDQHMVREGHRYKLVGLRARTVVVAVALHGRDSGQPGHYTLGASTPAPRFTLPEGLIKGERAYEDLVLDRVSWLNRWFDIEAYSCAVREARSDGADDAPSSPLKQGMANRPCAGGCGTLSIPSSLAYAREDLTQSFHRLSVCVYGNSLLENGDANLLLSSAEGGSDKSVAQMPSLCTFSDLTSSIDSNYVQPEESSEHAQASDRSELQYEELWTEQTALAASRYCCVSSLGLDSCSKAPRGGLVLRRGLSQEPQGPPPVPPKSDAVRVECRMLNAPPVPPRSGRPSSSPPLPPRSVPPSPNLSFYSSGLLHLVDDAFDKIGGSSEWTKPPQHNRSCKRIRPSSVGHPSPRHNADGVSNGTRRGSGPDTNSMSFYEQQPIFPGFAQTSLATVDFHSQSHVLAFPPPVTKVETLKNMSDKTPVSNGHTDVPNMSPVCKSSSPHDEFHLSKACARDHSRSPKHILAAEGSKPHSGCNCDCCIISTPNSPCTLPGDIDWPTETTECVPPSLPFCGTPGDRSSGDGMAWQPPDELSGLSVEGVCQCLRFIGLSEEALGRFSHECVDGALLTQLTEEMLLLDFQLSKLQARKVLQFAGGWRPKL